MHQSTERERWMQTLIQCTNMPFCSIYILFVFGVPMIEDCSSSSRGVIMKTIPSSKFFWVTEAFNQNSSSRRRKIVFISRAPHRTHRLKRWWNEHILSRVLLQEKWQRTHRHTHTRFCRALGINTPKRTRWWWSLHFSPLWSLFAVFVLHHPF